MLVLYVEPLTYCFIVNNVKCEQTIVFCKYEIMLINIFIVHLMCISTLRN